MNQVRSFGIPVWWRAFLAYGIAGLVVLPLLVLLLAAAVLTFAVPNGGIGGLLVAFFAIGGLLSSKSWWLYAFFAFILGPFAGLINAWVWKKIVSSTGQGSQSVLARLSLEVLVIGVILVVATLASILLMSFIHPFFFGLIPLAALYGLYRLVQFEPGAPLLNRLVATLVTVVVWSIVFLVVFLLMGYIAIVFMAGLR